MVIDFLQPPIHAGGAGVQLFGNPFGRNPAQMQLYGLGLLLSIVLDRPTLCGALLRTGFAVVGPSAFRAFSFAGPNIGESATRTRIQAVSVSDYEGQLQRDGGEEKSVVVNLEIPPLMDIIPPQSEIRNTAIPLLLPAVKPVSDFSADSFSRRLYVSRG